jgi:hypothetical protein
MFMSVKRMRGYLKNIKQYKKPPWSIIIVEKVTITQMGKKYPI